VGGGIYLNIGTKEHSTIVTGAQSRTTQFTLKFLLTTANIITIITMEGSIYKVGSPHLELIPLFTFFANSIFGTFNPMKQVF
jgi:hypothetical protein